MQQTPQQDLVAESGVHPAGTPPTTGNEQPKTPIAYEEVTLTDAAAELLERKNAELAKRTPPKMRRVATGDPAEHRG